jgi:hypothetical protein
MPAADIREQVKDFKERYAHGDDIEECFAPWYLTVMEQEPRHVRVEKAGEVIDDVVGPMVNRRVTVDALRRADGKYLFRDIQPVE